MRLRDREGRLVDRQHLGRIPCERVVKTGPSITKPPAARCQDTLSSAATSEKGRLRASSASRSRNRAVTRFRPKISGCRSRLVLPQVPGACDDRDRRPEPPDTRTAGAGAGAGTGRGRSRRPTRSGRTPEGVWRRPPPPTPHLTTDDDTTSRPGQGTRCNRSSELSFVVDGSHNQPQGSSATFTHRLPRRAQIRFRQRPGPKIPDETRRALSRGDSAGRLIGCRSSSLLRVSHVVSQTRRSRSPFGLP